MEDVIKTAADKTAMMFAEVKQHAEGAVAKSTRLIEEMTDFGKGNVEALVETSKIAARGYQAMGQDAVAFARTSMETTTEQLKTLAAVKNPADFMKLQGEFLRQSFDKMVAHTSRSTETSLKLAGEIAQPIQNRLALAGEKIKAAA